LRALPENHSYRGSKNKKKKEAGWGVRWVTRVESEHEEKTRKTGKTARGIKKKKRKERKKNVL